jgi:hypothetical protein
MCPNKNTAVPNEARTKYINVGTGYLCSMSTTVKLTLNRQRENATTNEHRCPFNPMSWDKTDITIG